MRSQEQIVGYVLLGVIVLSISIAVYNYVIPTIQKANVRNTALTIEDNVKKLSDVIASTGFRYGKSSFEFEAPNTQVEIIPDQIKIKLKAPIRYYSSYIRVPVNYYEPTICYNNSFPVIAGKSYTLCFDDSKIYLNITNQNIIIQDVISNKSITLPFGNYKNIITFHFVFDIYYNGTHLTFTPIYPTGIYKVSPACISNAYQLGEDIYYEITCRPVVDLSTKTCYWIRISPYYKSSTDIRDKLSLSINYNYYEDTTINSTACDSVRMIYLYVSIT